MDVRTLKPSEAVRLLNSTRLGECINAAKLRRHRDRAGSRIGGTTSVDLIRYVSWLAAIRHSPAQADPYGSVRERANQRQREISTASREIGELPPVENPDRRAACRLDFGLFCKTYFAEIFTLPWSSDHLKVISRIQQVATVGEKFALAMPRASGKTALSTAACVWAILYLHRRFIAVVGPESGHAERIIASQRGDFERNDTLLADFPEVCFPLRKLDGIAQRRLLYRGERISMGFTANSMMLPNLKEPRFAGGYIQSTSLTGQIRGMHFKRDDGRVVRPDMVILDDPQKDEAARSPAQVAKLERVIKGAVMGLAGPGSAIAAIMPCTVVCKDDLADRFLDRSRNPIWNGERLRMVYQWPVNEKLWDRYGEIRRSQGPAASTAYYAANRRKMDLGGEVAWPDNFRAGELSAIQYAMNIRIDESDQVFQSEYQNDPLPEILTDAEQLNPADLAERVSGVARGSVPATTTKMTMFIDVQKSLLFFVVCAWEENFSGYVVDYGVWPAQRSPFTTLRDTKVTLQTNYPRAGLEGAIFSGLTDLVGRTVGGRWRADDGTERQIDRCLIDAQWGDSTETIRRFCRESEYARTLLPSHGKAFGPAVTPLSDYKQRPGERLGPSWVVGPGRGGLARQRRVLYDSNHWKSFAQTRLTTTIGDPGAMAFYGRRHNVNHGVFIDHLTSEYPIWLSGRGREMYQWELRPGRDNHWWDCLVGCCVAASIEGVRIEAERRSVARKRVSWREKAANARRRHGVA